MIALAPVGRLPIGTEIQHAVQFMLHHMQGLFDAITFVIGGLTGHDHWTIRTDMTYEILRRTEGT